MNTIENHTFLYKKIEDKTIVWSSIAANYLLLENTTAQLLNGVSKGKKVELLAKQLTKKIDIPIEESVNFILAIKQRFFKSIDLQNTETPDRFDNIEIPKRLPLYKFYKIGDTVIKVGFSTKKVCFLVHPQFSHLEVTERLHTLNFKVFTDKTQLFLVVNDTIINGWKNTEVHLFQGKFSMELIQAIHKKKEEEWLGVFHASAVSNTKKAILFLGDSGNGKSTSLALLQAHGFTCIADDFVPVASKDKEVYSFPAAISIKKNSLPILKSFYPELNDATEYNLKRLNKVVRYLPPNNTDFSTHLPCKELVFIKYEEKAAISFKKISKLLAFQQLVPDSWLSPKKENAAIFLDWFEQLTCYQLTYSDNDEMIAGVSKLFDNEL